MTGKFETKEEIIKWKYRGKIEAKSENDFVKKYPIKAPEEGKRIRRKRNIWRGQLGSKLLQTRMMISFPVFLNCQDVYQSMFECVSKNVISLLKSKRKVQ